MAADKVIVKAGDQAIHRRPTPSGNVVTYGNVVSIEAGNATVFFPTEKLRRTIPVDQLELTSKVRPGVSHVDVKQANRVRLERYNR